MLLWWDLPDILWSLPQKGAAFLWRFFLILYCKKVSDRHDQQHVLHLVLNQLPFLLFNSLSLSQIVMLLGEGLSIHSLSSNIYMDGAIQTHTLIKFTQFYCYSLFWAAHFVVLNSALLTCITRVEIKNFFEETDNKCYCNKHNFFQFICYMLGKPFKGSWRPVALLQTLWSSASGLQ